MAVSFEEFADELRAFNDRREVINEIRKDLRKPLPDLRSKVRANAIATLPSRGGFGAWVARARLSVRFQDGGRSAGVSVKVSRVAGDGDKADLKALDDTGRIRHPLWGHRGHWYGQSVASGFFSRVWDRTQWVRIADDAFDRALDKIRRG